MLIYNNYQNTANYYDHSKFFRTNFSIDEVNFYVKKSLEVAGNILELGCGTGRITIPIAKTGKIIYGIDFSEKMLDILKQKINESSCSEINIITYKQELSEFYIDKKFDLIIIPFRTYHTLLTENSRDKCLKLIFSHLNENGYFIVDLFPNNYHNQMKVGESQQWQEFNEDLKQHVKRTSLVTEIDTKNQIVFTDVVFEIGNTNEKLIFTDKFAFSILETDIFKNNLVRHGFTIVNEFGYFDETEITPISERIYICKKRQYDNQQKKYNLSNS